MSFVLVQVSPFQVLQTYPADAPPDPVIWPDGVATHGTGPGYARGAWMFCNAVFTPTQPGPLFTLASSTPALNGSTVIYTQVWTPPTLSTAQSVYFQMISDAAEARFQLVSSMPGGGHAAVHQRKAAEANALSNDLSPNPANYPMLAALVGIQASTLGAVGTSVLVANSAWAAAVAHVEATRVSGLLTVAAATTFAGAAAAFNSISWPTQSGTGIIA